MSKSVIILALTALILLTTAVSQHYENDKIRKELGSEIIKKDAEIKQLEEKINEKNIAYMELSKDYLELTNGRIKISKETFNDLNATSGFALYDTKYGIWMQPSIVANGNTIINTEIGNMTVFDMYFRIERIKMVYYE